MIQWTMRWPPLEFLTPCQLSVQFLFSAFQVDLLLSVLCISCTFVLFSSLLRTPSLFQSITPQLGVLYVFLYVVGACKCRYR